MNDQANAPAPTVELEYKTELHPDPIVAQLIAEVEALLQQVEEKRRQIEERLKHGSHPR